MKCTNLSVQTVDPQFFFIATQLSITVDYCHAMAFSLLGPIFFCKKIDIFVILSSWPFSDIFLAQNCSCLLRKYCFFAVNSCQNVLLLHWKLSKARSNHFITFLNKSLPFLKYHGHCPPELCTVKKASISVNMANSHTQARWNIWERWWNLPSFPSYFLGDTLTLFQKGGQIIPTK